CRGFFWSYIGCMTEHSPLWVLRRWVAHSTAGRCRPRGNALMLLKCRSDSNLRVRGQKGGMANLQALSRTTFIERQFPGRNEVKDRGLAIPRVFDSVHGV